MLSYTEIKSKLEDNWKQVNTLIAPLKHSQSTYRYENELHKISKTFYSLTKTRSALACGTIADMNDYYDEPQIDVHQFDRKVLGDQALTIVMLILHANYCLAYHNGAQFRLPFEHELKGLKVKLGDSLSYPDESFIKNKLKSNGKIIGKIDDLTDFLFTSLNWFPKSNVDIDQNESKRRLLFAPDEEADEYTLDLAWNSGDSHEYELICSTAKYIYLLKIEPNS